jgi:hypothetical protein
LTALAAIYDSLLEPDGAVVARDLALSCNWPWNEIGDAEAEFDRVRAANTAEVMVLCDGKEVRCAGMQAITPESGGDLKGWMAARISRLWRRRKRRWLFEYTTKTQVRRRDGSRGPGSVIKQQRWETKDFVDLDVGDSPAHLSGIGGGKRRGVLGPRRNEGQSNHALDFGENA